jgi:hypothetical protein
LFERYWWKTFKVPSDSLILINIKAFTYMRLQSKDGRLSSTPWTLLGWEGWEDHKEGNVWCLVRINIRNWSEESGARYKTDLVHSGFWIWIWFVCSYGRCRTRLFKKQVHGRRFSVLQKSSWNTSNVYRNKGAKVKLYNNIDELARTGTAIKRQDILLDGCQIQLSKFIKLGWFKLEGRVCRGFWFCTCNQSKMD